MFSQTRSALLKVFCDLVLGLICESLLGMVLFFYIFFGKLFASSFIIIALRDHTTNWSYQESYRSSVLNSYLRVFFLVSLPYAYFVGEMILEIFEIYHQEINPNTSYPWTIGIILCGKMCRSSRRLFHLLYSFPRKRFVLTPMCLPCILWILLMYLILFWCFNWFR